MNAPFYKHTFCFNPVDNGGESLVLLTNFFKNEDGEIFTTQQLTLQSYCNSAAFELAGTQMTPNNLNKLANELEAAQTKAQLLIKESHNVVW